MACLSSSHVFVQYGLTLFAAAVFCLTSILPGSAQAESSAFEDTYNDAEQARMEAASVNSEWRDVKWLLGRARRLAESGDYEQAIEFAEQAEEQAENGYLQHQINRSFLTQVPYYSADTLPAEDLEVLQTYFLNKFPTLQKKDFAHGVYALDASLRQNLEQIEVFPMYEESVDQGRELWDHAFSNGETYENCFGGVAVANQYPRWDALRSEVVTLPLAINYCREVHGEKRLTYTSDEMLSLTAYIAYESRGLPVSITIPENDPAAIEAYRQGKEYYFSRRGQLNLACFHCHLDNTGLKLRSNLLSPATGQTAHWPVYSFRWDGMGSLHRQYKACNEQVRARPLKEQSVIYRNLEFFHSFISNDVPLTGPVSRF